MILKELFQYLRNPQHPETKEIRITFSNAWETFRIWTFVYLLSLLGVPIAFYISNLNGASFVDHAGYQYSANRSMIQVIWTALIFFPIWEEMVFRLGLKLSRINLSLGSTALILYFSRLAFIILDVPRPSWLLEPDSFLGTLSIIIFGLILAPILWSMLKGVGYERLGSFYRRRFGMIFYIPLVIFAFLHALNFDRSLWVFIPLITLPQLFLALGFGFVRIKYGIFWSVVMHVLNNTFSFVPALILEEISQDILNRFIQGDFTAINELTANNASIYFAFSFIWSLLGIGMFLSFVSLIWDWVKNRNTPKNYAVISSTLNCLLPGLGQFYNGHGKKGKMLIGFFVLITLLAAIIFSIPSNYSSVEKILSYGRVVFIMYVPVFTYAVIDSWIIGHRLDKARS